jgi:hypothetical protein
LRSVRQVSEAARRRPLVATIVLLSCLAAATIPLGAFSAQAHVQTFRSSVSIHYIRRHQHFTGVVGASRECRVGRLVEVFRQVPGAPDPLVGSDTTDARGKYGPIPSPGPGYYYAKVAEREAGGYGHDHLCRAGTSKTIRVGTRAQAGSTVVDVARR